MKIHAETYRKAHRGFWRGMYYATYLLQVAFALSPIILLGFLVYMTNFSPEANSALGSVAASGSTIAIFTPFSYFKEWRWDLERDHL